MLIILSKYELVAEKLRNPYYISFIKALSKTFGSVIIKE